MRIETVTTGERLGALGPAWDALWRARPDATPFQSPHWLLPWWRAFGSGEIFVIAVHDDDRLTALAPFFILRDEDDSLGMLFGTGVSDYLDVLGDASHVGEALASADCRMWDLQQLRPESPLLAVTPPGGWSDAVEDHDVCPLLDLRGAGDVLQNIGSTHFRKKLRYFRRCAAREGAVEYIAATPGNLDALLDALFDLHAARWKARGLPGVLADDAIRAFHRDAARRMLDAGALRMYAMRIGGRTAAIFYGFAHHATVYYYLGGWDPALERLSPGMLIVAHAIEEAVREGAASFDFLRGAEDYKYAWGAVDRVNRRRQLVRRN